jgi:hypothetical protein
MTNIKKLSYFIILFAMSNMVQGGNYNKASLELNGIEDGKTYSSPIKINFIVKNMKVVKAGVNEKNSGHHHLLLNLDEMPNLKMPLPMTENILHYGKGQTSTTLELSPGKHTIQLLFADYSHTPHNPPLMTKKITIFIK